MANGYCAEPEGLLAGQNQRDYWLLGRTRETIGYWAETEGLLDTGQNQRDYWLLGRTRGTIGYSAEPEGLLAIGQNQRDC
jgi:hypothetical protein